MFLKNLTESGGESKATAAYAHPRTHIYAYATPEEREVYDEVGVSRAQRDRSSFSSSCIWPPRSVRCALKRDSAPVDFLTPYLTKGTSVSATGIGGKRNLAG